MLAPDIKAFVDCVLSVAESLCENCGAMTQLGLAPRSGMPSQVYVMPRNVGHSAG